MESKVTTSVVKGLIISLILIVLSLIITLTGLETNKGLGSIPLILFIAGIIWGCISYAKQMNGNVSFGNVFAHGFKITAAVTVIMIIFTAISLSFINPETKNIALEEARKSLEAQKMNDDQIEQALSISREYFLPMAIGGILLTYLVVGLISSLIGAAVAKKNPSGPFVQQG
ncbi:MAG: hypothetical protein JWQ96_918 [Segetibacter sp.]|nr:hypothetical protein [Segetibacter sp.]